MRRDKTRATSDERRILIAGGGTGGHLFPAIAVAEEIAGLYPAAKIVFVGTAKGLETRVIPHTMWELILMDVPQLKGMGLLRKLKTIFSVPRAMVQAFFILLRHKPDLVIGVGGYAAGPLSLVASLIGIKTVAMEQNAIPGLTNRILGRFVDRIFATFAESAGYFSAKKVIVSGNPVRKKIRDASQHKPVKRDKFTILAFGGSQGAMAINEGMIDALSHLSDIRDDIHIIHQIGRGEDAERFNAAYRARGFSAEIYHFIEDMGKIYSSVDMVVCRAGSTSVAELTVTGRPAILIPYPYATDNHQAANARVLADAGGAVVISESELTGEKLADEIKGLLAAPLRLAGMAEAAKRFGHPDAAGVIVSECMKLVRVGVCASGRLDASTPRRTDI